VAARDAWARPPSLPGTSPWSSTRDVRAHVKMFSKLVGQYRWPWFTVRRRMGERKLALPPVDCEGVGRFAQAASSVVGGSVGTSRARPVDTTSMNCSRSRKRDEGFARLQKGNEAAVSNGVYRVWHGSAQDSPRARAARDRRARVGAVAFGLDAAIARRGAAAFGLSHSAVVTAHSSHQQALGLRGGEGSALTRPWRHTVLAWRRVRPTTRAT
jgi:hypothetical protein